MLLISIVIFEFLFCKIKIRSRWSEMIENTSQLNSPNFSINSYVIFLSNCQSCISKSVVRSGSRNSGYYSGIEVTFTN